MNHARRHSLLVGCVLVAVAGLAPLLPPVAAQAAPAQACTSQSHWLPSRSILRLTSQATGDVVLLQRHIRHGAYTVRVAVNGQDLGESYVPVDLGSIQVRMQLRLTLETSYGSVRQAYKEKPIVHACSNWIVDTIPV